MHFRPHILYFLYECVIVNDDEISVDSNAEISDGRPRLNIIVP